MKCFRTKCFETLKLQLNNKFMKEIVVVLFHPEDGNNFKMFLAWENPFFFTRFVIFPYSLVFKSIIAAFFSQRRENGLKLSCRKRYFITISYIFLVSLNYIISTHAALKN